MKRTQRSRTEVDQILQDYDNSSKTQKEFCQKHDIPMGTFNWWLKRKRKELKTISPSTRSTFIQANRAAQAASSTNAPVLRLDFPSGLRLRWYSNDIPHEISSVVARLAKL